MNSLQLVIEIMIGLISVDMFKTVIVLAGVDGYIKLLMHY